MMLQSCGDPESGERRLAEPSPKASQSKPSFVQDPSQRARTPSETMEDIGPDIRMEVQKAVVCEVAASGVPITSGKIRYLQGRVKANGGKAPPCRVRMR